MSRARHDLDSVVITALRLLDDHGLAELTMRRLATELEVQASALYWHVENKQTLLARVADRILAAARPSPPARLGWREATAIEAAAVRDALLAFRDGAEVVTSTRALGLGAHEAHARLRRALERGHDAAQAEVAATALLHLVIGDATLAQQRIQADSLGAVADSADTADSTTNAASTGDAAFREGIDLLLEGLAQRSRQRAGLS